MLIKSTKPIVVHCSAGCGRTGTFIAICNGIVTLEILKKCGKLNTESGYSLVPRISIFAIVRRLREQRWTMVRTELQYKSIYDFIIFYLQKHK